ncbi:MAG: class I SAM-dependent methyltransferase [Xanthobacteraceae bacterium]|jgi:demethylmenaquinone methyltransferase / 2-methoxy-6-polyprenyl-1,4-benzoquinol methylase
MKKNRDELAEQFFSGNAATYDQIARFSTLGLDGFWKRKILNKIPKTSNRIIEQASGTGILTCKIARRLPKCRITGVELQEEYLNIARNKAWKLTNVEFIHGRAEEVVLEGEFDCIVSAYLAKYVELDLLVVHARKMLREGGVLIMHELTRPTNFLFLALWKMHFKFLQTYGKWKHPEWDIAFRDVPLLLEKTQWVNRLTRALRANEFVDIEVEYLTFGASAIVSAKNTYPSRDAL